VIDAPYPIRKFIVEACILPFRPSRSAHSYQQIWWEQGSPLIVISRRLQSHLRKHVDIPVELAMRYGNPSIESAVRRLVQRIPVPEEIYLIPLYPHYAMATYETVVTETRRVLAGLKGPVQLNVHAPFYDAPGYIHALVESARPYLEQDFDHMLFSYHGMPERHCRKTDPTGYHCFRATACCETPSEAHETCYRHQTLRTTREFVKMTRVPEQKYSIAFQ
jgi:ferrochelatase